MDDGGSTLALVRDSDMNEQVNLSLSSAKKAVVDALNGRGKKSYFATELLAGLRRFHIGKNEMDQALSELQTEGVVIVRDNFCADPHLAEVDLRVIAVIDTGRGDDAHVAALHEIELAWNKWLGEYLVNHRCG